MLLKSKAIWVDVTFYPEKGGIVRESSTHAQTCWLISLLQTTARTLSSISDNFIWQMLYCLFVNLASYIFQTDLFWLEVNLTSFVLFHTAVTDWFSFIYIWSDTVQIGYDHPSNSQSERKDTINRKDQIIGTGGNSTCKETDEQT